MMSWFSKPWCIHSVENYLIIKQNESHLYVLTWKGIEDILSSENKHVLNNVKGMIMFL